MSAPRYRPPGYRRCMYSRWPSGAAGNTTPVGRLHHLIVDCPDPMAEARFWSAVLGDPISYADDDFVVVSAGTAASGLAFQRATDLTPPTWPDPAVPQQMHLDVMVDDQHAASQVVLALGARRGERRIRGPPFGAAVRRSIDARSSCPVS